MAPRPASTSAATSSRHSQPAAPRSPAARAWAICKTSLLVSLVAFTLVGAASQLAQADEGALPAVAHASDEASDVEVPPAAQAPDSSHAHRPAAEDTTPGKDTTPGYLRLLSLFGVGVYLLIAIGLSAQRSRIQWRLVAIGLSLQVGLGLFILRTRVGEAIFSGAGAAFTRVLGFTADGTRLLFGSFLANGEMMPALVSMAFVVFPSIIFFSSLMALFYHLGWMQKIVGAMAAVMRRTMRTSGAESLSAAANIFVGQTEAPLMIRPYVQSMTRSELMAVMTGGFATVAGGVMASYVGFLQAAVPTIAENLLAASVMAAPGGLVIAKLMQPEVDTPVTADSAEISGETRSANIIDAVASGASDGLALALNVGAMLLAFVALVSMANYVVALPSYIQHGVALNAVWDSVQHAGIVLPEALAACDPRLAPFEARADCVRELAALSPNSSMWPLWSTLRLEQMIGWVFWPFAAVAGVPFHEIHHLAELYGQKFVLNEFIAYVSLLGKITDPDVQLSARTVTIASFALCGFANLGSIAIQLGGIGSMAPERRAEVAQLGFRAMIGGTLATWMTGAIVGVLL